VIVDHLNWEGDPLRLHYTSTLTDNNNVYGQWLLFINKGNNKITELRTILQRESQITPFHLNHYGLSHL
jgi:hypothetical protein